MNSYSVLQLESTNLVSLNRLDRPIVSFLLGNIIFKRLLLFFCHLLFYINYFFTLHYIIVILNLYAED